LPLFKRRPNSFRSNTAQSLTASGAFCDRRGRGRRNQAMRRRSIMAHYSDLCGAAQRH
jgi:hypothetical protein